MQAKKLDPFFPFHQVLETSPSKPVSPPLSIPPLAPSPDFTTSSFLRLDEDLEYRSKLINDMSLITVGEFSLLALVSSNIIYLMESSKKDEVLKFRDSIILDIKEKQGISFPPAPILFPLPPETLLCCDFGFSSRLSGSASGQLDLTLACGGRSGVISLISIEEEYPVNYLIGHINEINVLRYAPPNPRFSFLNILASGSKDGGIIIWNVSHGTKVATLEPRANPHSDVVYLTWGMGGEFLVSVHLESNVKIWEITAGFLKKLELSHERINLQNDKGKKEEGCKEIWEGKEAHKSFGMQIDQVECFGYGLVSKDVMGNVVVWMPSIEVYILVLIKESLFFVKKTKNLINIH